MIIVTIEGLPKKVTASAINYALRPELQRAVADIAELNIAPENVSVFIHQEHTESCPQNNIVVYVDISYEHGKTNDVLERLRAAVKKTVEKFDFAKNVQVDCVLRRINLWIPSSEDQE